IDGGLSWSNPLKINKVSGDCHDGDWTVEGAVPCVDVDGVLFVVWAGPLGLVLDYSKDGGNTWLQEDLKIGDFPGGWDYDIPGLSRCNGLPITASDQSPGPYRGNWYLNWSDQRNGSNDTDVWVAKSTNKGLNWSAPVRVNTDGPGKQQFMSWMTVDPVTGWVWVVFYDRRAYSENSLRTDVYLAVSKDGGQNFSNFKISENDFSPNSSQFFGDYTNISAYNNIIRPIWTRQDGQNTSVWTALVDVHQIPLGLDKESGQIMENSEPNFPNPATDVVWVPFKIRRNTAVSMVVLDQTGRIVHTVFENKLYEYGKYTEMVDLKPLNLPNGNYYIQLRSAEKVLNQKLVLLGDK
ncbi:MAG: T9SS type A sorting domain-containing protein, partial [Bacteroidetes bacterium]|nr:T9SS type A sorting domain-containing protein [Bacteroidota bacterium]